MSTGNSNDPPVGTEERRGAARVPVDIRVDYKSEDTFLFASIRNISEVGIFIETKAPLPPGTKLNLRFEIPEGKGIEAAGEVMWVNAFRPDGENLNPGMGVRFIDFSAAARDRVMLLIRKIALIDDEEGEMTPAGSA